MSKFDSIRPYDDSEVHEALQTHYRHPMFQALLQFTFPEKSLREIKEIINECHSIYDFQSKIIYKSVQKIMEKSTDGFSTSGFEHLNKEQS